MHVVFVWFPPSTHARSFVVRERFMQLENKYYGGTGAPCVRSEAHNLFEELYTFISTLVDEGRC